MTGPTDTRPVPGAPRRKFFADVIVPSTGGDRYDRFRRTWALSIGEAFPLPPTVPTRAGDYRLAIRVSRIHDAVVADIYNGANVIGGTGGDFDHFSGLVAMHVVRRGTWHFARPRDRDRVAASAGEFVIRDNGPSWQFAVEPHTMVTKLVLSGAQLGPQTRKRPFVGSADSAEVRLLLAHLHMVDATLDDLSPAGVQAARNALIELVAGVFAQKVDGTEPQLAPSLVQAAKTLADSHLAEPELSPAMLARELNVSVRTLHRAFAATDQSVAAYVRQRRLEQTRLALTMPVGRPDVSELASYWQFADSSHFIRAFKKQYGQTPAQYARSHRRDLDSTNGR